MRSRFERYINEYPKAFWTLVVAVFIDHIGSALLYPFLALYVTRHFNVGMTEAGQMFSIFAITAISGSFIGGAIADKFGRKRMILIGILASASASLLLGFIHEISVFYIAVGVSGLLANAGSPAQNAMVADLLPQEKQASGFGIIRVAYNVSFAIGPVLGGFLAEKNFLLLFILDAALSLITAVFIFVLIPETKPAETIAQKAQTLAMTFTGYLSVFKDRLFVLVIAALVLIQTVYEQLNTTLPVFLRDSHGILPSQFGLLLSMNAIMVVFLQIWITNRTTKIPPMLVMAFSGLMYLIGFGIFGFFATMPWFILGIILITIGEMAQSPVALSAVSRFASEDKRGRYMAFFEFGWVLPSTYASYCGGLVLDNLNPNWLWYGCILVGLLVILVYTALHIFGGNKIRVSDQEYQRIMIES
ncbi:MAG: MFS transporter [Anaerolineaceae bacterium]|nr:MFS transporter [Anaerolineaceae bacterium]